MLRSLEERKDKSSDVRLFMTGRKCEEGLDGKLQSLLFSVNFLFSSDKDNRSG